MFKTIKALFVLLHEIITGLIDLVLAITCWAKPLRVVSQHEATLFEAEMTAKNDIK